MNKLILRFLLATIFSVFLSSIGVAGEDNVLQTLFTILGIVFSICMSLLVSFNLSPILNNKIRMRIRMSINKSIKMLVCDFLSASVFFMIATVICENFKVFTFNVFRIDLVLTAICVTMVSLVYEIYNFKRIHQLNVDMEEQIIKEQIIKKQEEQRLKEYNEKKVQSLS